LVADARIPAQFVSRRSILPAGNPEVRTEILAQPIRRYTANSITNRTRLVRELDEIRRTGIAVEREEAAIGGCCLASPVLLAGRPLAAISVSVPTDRFKPELLAPAVRTAALALSRALSRTPRPTDESI